MCKKISLPVIMCFTQYKRATGAGKTHLLTMLISKIFYGFRVPGFERLKYNFPVPISRLAGVKF